MSRVLVTGGTGVLGRRLIPRLVTAGHEVRTLSRREHPNIPEGVGAVRGDLATGEGVREAVDGVEVIMHCASSAFRRTRATDVGGTQTLTEAAEGSPHLVYISIVGVDRNPLRYYRAKLAAEQAIETSGLRFTILRTTQFHDLVLDALQRLRRLPVLPVPKGFRFQPIDVDEVADRLAELVGGEPAGRVPDMGGPQVRTTEDLAASYLAARGSRARLLRIPVPGHVGRAFRVGANTCPEHGVGALTWEEFLESRGIG